MRVYEQVYTSSPRLLEGGGNLGVVAETRGFPRELAPALAPLRAYTLLDRYDLATPAAHPPRLVLGPANNGLAYAVTRTVFAGADHTGRTTPLTHHVVANIADARSEFRGAAELVQALWPLMKSAWPDEPKWIDPPHQATRGAPLAVAPPAWLPLLPWLAGTMIDFNRTGRAAVLVIDPDDAAEIPAGLVAVLSLLPPSLQWSCTIATHAVAVGDFIREAGLLVTYPDAPLLDQCRQRRDSRAPLVIDLTCSPQMPTVSPGTWGELLCRSATVDGRQRLGKHFDALGLTAADVPAFAGASKLVDDLAAAPAGATSEEWKMLARRIAAVHGSAGLVRWVTDATAHAVRILAADEHSATRWHTLAAVTADSSWPVPARTAAADALLDGGPDALDAAAEALDSNDPADDVFRPGLQGRPTLPHAALASATAGGDMRAVRRAAFVLSHATLGRDEGRRVVAALFAAPPTVRQTLHPAVLRALGAGVAQADEIASLAGAHAEAPRAVVLPLLLHRMRHTHDAQWQILEARYREIAINAGVRPQDYAVLFTEFGLSMAHGINKWLDHPSLDASQRNDIRAAAEQSGVIAPAPTATLPTHDKGISPPPEQHEAQVHWPRSVMPIGSVGPIRTCRVLAVLVLIATGASVFVLNWLRGGSGAVTGRPELIFAAACVGLTVVTEAFVRLFVRSPQHFGFARWGRRGVALLLLLALPVAAWPGLTTWKPSLDQKFRSYLPFANDGSEQ